MLPNGLLYGINLGDGVRGVGPQSQPRRSALLVGPGRLAQEQPIQQVAPATLDLGREFDLVFVHDAIVFATTREALCATMQTAYRHCRPGGAAVFNVHDGTKLYVSTVKTLGAVFPSVALHPSGEGEVATVVTAEPVADDVLAKREAMNEILRVKLDEVTERWGVKVTNVEIREIIPPPQVQDAMTRQMSAERTRRAVVTEAEGAKQAAITVESGPDGTTTTTVEVRSTRIERNP